MNHFSIYRILMAAVVAAVALTFDACSSSRQVSASTGASQTHGSARADVGSGRTAPARRTSEVSALAAACADWDNVYMPVNVKIAKPMSLSASGRITMVRDRSIHLSMRVLGFEVAAAYVDADSVWLVDKVHKMMCVASTARITGANRFTVGNLQDMLLGHLFYPGQGTLQASADFERLFSVNHEAGATRLLPRHLTEGADWYAEIDDVPHMTALKVLLSEAAGFEVDYSDFAYAAAGDVAGTLAASGQAGRIAIDATLRWNLDKAQWNGNRDASWTPPTGYKRITPEQLVAVLKSM